jgi:hypothetical protein
MIEMSSTNKNDSDIKASCKSNIDINALCKSDRKTTDLETTFELTTLYNIIDLSKECIKFLDLLQDKRRQILLDIKNNENDFFEKNPIIVSHFNSLFDPTRYKNNVKAFVNELEDTAEVYCRHEYVEDLIDVDYDRSQRIVYCQLCELTKR